MRPNCTTHARVTTDSSPPTTADSRTMTAPTPTAARSPLAPNIDTTRTPPTVLRDSRSGSPRGSRSPGAKKKTDRQEGAARVARDPPDGGPVWGVGVPPGCGGRAGASRSRTGRQVAGFFDNFDNVDEPNNFVIAICAAVASASDPASRPQS